MKKVYEVTSPFNENVDWETKDVWGIPVLWNKLPDKIIDNIFDECLYNIYFVTPGGFIEEKTVVALRPLDKLNTERKIKGFLRDLETFELGVACELGDDKIIVFIWE